MCSQNKIHTKTSKLVTKDISLFLGVKLFKPQIIFPQLMLHNAHAQRADLEVRNHAVELRET